MAKRKDYEIAAENFAVLAKSLGLDITAQFIPFSQSRNAGEKHKSLNWRCAVTCNGRPIAGLESVDYSAGIAYCPAYNSSKPEFGRKSWGGGMSIARDAAVTLECETGKIADCRDGRGAFSTGKPIATIAADDVLASLARDSDVLDYARFEDWASDIGYDPDSRKGEAIYRLCLQHALALRSAIGESNLCKLREFAGEM